MASNKTAKTRRRYELKARARRRDETRRRITEAAVRLHDTVGPARTTIAEVARLAGVRRMTVYNHFPTEDALIDACSSHWMERHPLPDIRRWAEIDDPDARCREALTELYAWYRSAETMMTNVIRDAALVPALDAIMGRKWRPALEEMVEILLVGRGDPGGAAHAAARAALRLVVRLETWQTLSGSGLDDADAARMSARFVRSA